VKVRLFERLRLIFTFLRLAFFFGLDGLICDTRRIVSEQRQFSERAAKQVKNPVKLRRQNHRKTQ
jgi:hypothetical protein